MQKPIVPSDLYRSIRDTLLVGLTGYSKQVQWLDSFFSFQCFDSMFMPTLAPPWKYNRNTVWPFLFLYEDEITNFPLHIYGFFSNPQCCPKLIWLWTVLYVLLLLLVAWRIFHHSRCFNEISIINHNKCYIQFSSLLPLYPERLLLCVLICVSLPFSGTTCLCLWCWSQYLWQGIGRLYFYD
jgi:hypothetical protein